MTPVLTGLQQAVANTTVLTFLTLSAHWNVVGPDFFQLHKALEGQYEDLFDSIDTIAERMRALDGTVKACLTEMETAAGMPCISASMSARGMVDTLLTAHAKNVADLKALAAAARECGDPVTENMALEWLEAEDKRVWMLKSWTK